MQEIVFFDKYVGKILPVTYTITGDGDAPVLPNVSIKSPYKTKEHGKRVITLKKYTEQMIIDGAVDGKYYI